MKSDVHIDFYPFRSREGHLDHEAMTLARSAETVELLEETLREEKAADEKLTKIAEAGINASAAEIAHPERVPQPATAGVGGGSGRSERASALDRSGRSSNRPRSRSRRRR